MQRLYSTFPGAWPGFALLLLRCVAAAALIAYASGGVWRSLEPALLIMHGLTIIVAISLIGGLWTPLAGIAQALLQMYGNFSGTAGSSIINDQYFIFRGNLSKYFEGFESYALHSEFIVVDGKENADIWLLFRCRHASAF